MGIPTRTLAIVAMLALAACQSEGVSDPSEPDSSESTTTSSTTTLAIASTVPSTTAVQTEAPASTTDDGANPLGGNAAEDALMPLVVCMNLQDAQDEIQDHGVFGSRSEDATGQDRNQILDSNWQVVAQSPDAGVAIGEFEATLFVVKYGEQPNPC